MHVGDFSLACTMRVIRRVLHIALLGTNLGRRGKDSPWDMISCYRLFLCTVRYRDS